MIGYASFYRGGATDGLADSREIVVHEVQGNRVPMVLELFAVASRQAREAAHILAHCLTVLLNKRGTDERGIGTPDSHVLANPDALRWAVAMLDLVVGFFAVVFHQHCVIDIAVKSILHGAKVNCMPIGCYLNARRDPLRYAVHEICASRALRRPTCHATISLESAPIAVQVQTSPNPNCP